jgi:uncharacterized protein YecT (DUF1311 family)
MEQQRSGFWATLPGLLTGAAALITAATGGYIAFDRTQKATAATAPDTPSAVEPKAATAIAPVADAGMAKPPAPSDTAPAGTAGFEAHAPAVGAAPPSPRQARPAFDCARASTAVETMVCSDAELADRDRQVAQQYFALRGSLPPHVRSQLLQSQRQFLQLRSDCPNSECLATLYDVRLRQLAQFAAN